MTSDTGPARLCGLKQAARRLGVPETWLREQVVQKRVPSLKAGARWLLCVDAVNDALIAMASKAPEAQQRAGGDDETV